MAAIFKFVTDGADKDLFDVVSFSGTEGLSQLYRYEIHVKALTTRVTGFVEEKELEDFIDEMLDHTARLITEEDGVQYPVHGVLASFDENQSAGGYTYYTAVLVPRLWKLSIYRTNEIYTAEKTVDKILVTILDQLDFIEDSDYSMSLSGELMSKDYVCQFRESDFHFISRLMENEGIYYYFEQGETAEKLMIVDGADYPVLKKPDVIFDVNAQAARRHESLFSWSRRTQRLPTHVSVRDYNPEQPSLDVHGTVDVDSLSDANGPGELCEYLYGDDFSNEEEAARLARLRAEEIACRKTRYYSEGAVCGFRTGYTFKLKQHPNALYNGKDYLLIEVSHEGTGLDSAADAANDKAQYSNAFVAIEVSTQFRPPLLTKKPRFYGTITAFVYAEAATGMAEVDAQGRYRVHLPFDRAEGGKESSDPNRKASCWVRMAQPFVGEDEGMYFPLKGGTEVLLTFINGDPDRPIISSALPNAATPSLLTDQTSTESIIKTGADNKIRMEDKKGSERIIMESPTANSWVRIGAPNDPADPYVVVEGKELSTYTDGDGSWQLIDASGNPITSKIAAIGDSAATYRLTKSLTVKRGSYFVTDTSPETALSGLPPSLNSSHRIDSRSYTLRDDLAATPISDGTTSATDFKDNLNRNYSFNVRNDSNKYQVDDDPLTGFSPSIGSSHTIFGTAWVLDEDMNTLNMNDGSSGLVRFYRDKSVALQVKTSGTDVDTGPGIRVRTGGNLWLEAKGQYGDYYVGKPSDAPSGVQSILDEIGGPSINPSGLKNHSSGVGEPLMNAIASAHVRVSDLDTFVLQKGYIYDFGPGANYNLVNGYIENHTNQSAALNQTAIRDRSQRPIGSDGKPIFGPLDGDLLNAGGPNWSSIIWPSYPGKLNSGQTRLDGNWSNANVWAEKKVGNAYDYMKGDSISVTKGDSLDVTYTGHRQVEVKLRDGKAPSYWKESEGGVTEEKKWNSDGDLLYRKTSTFATHTSSEWKYDINAPYGLFSYSTSAVSGAGVASFDFLFKASASALFNFGVSSSFTTSLAAKVDLELSAAANMKIGIGAGFDLKMYWNPAGELKLKNGEFEYHGIGSRLDKEAALKAKKQDLYLHYLTAHFSKRETELIATQVKVAAEKIGIKEGFSINL